MSFGTVLRFHFHAENQNPAAVTSPNQYRNQIKKTDGKGRVVAIEFLFPSDFPAVIYGKHSSRHEFGKKHVTRLGKCN